MRRAHRFKGLEPICRLFLLVLTHVTQQKK